MLRSVLAFGAPDDAACYWTRWLSDEEIMTFALGGYVPGGFTLEVVTSNAPDLDDASIIGG